MTTTDALLRIDDNCQEVRNGTYTYGISMEDYRTEQNRTEQNRAEQSRTEQNRTEQSRTEQNRTEQSRTEIVQNRAV